MAISDVQICNIALTRVGAARISSLSDDSENAALANLFYDYEYETVLGKYKWHCSTKRVRLAQDSTTPIYGYSYRYALPTSPKCLRVFSVYPTGEYKIEGNYLLTNSDEVYIRYAAGIDEGELDSHVGLVIATRLAIDFSNRIAQDANM